MSQIDVSTVPEIVKFGPYRVIGMNYTGKNEKGEIPALWSGENGFMTRACEIACPPVDEKIAFGVCRCIPGSTDGSFEYIAGVPTSDTASIPTGMVAVNIPACTYVVFPVASLNELPQIFDNLGPWLKTNPEWDGYCTPDKCDCATNPSFELYPETFCKDGKLFVYVPIRKK